MTYYTVHFTMTLPADSPADALRDAARRVLDPYWAGVLERQVQDCGTGDERTLRVAEVLPEETGR